MRKQIPTSKLLDLLDSLPEAPIKVNHKAAEVQKYIEFNNIQSGDSWLPAYFIYNHYSNWKSGGTLLKNSPFFKEFRKTFPAKKRIKYNYYQADYKSFGLTEEQYNTLMTEVDNAEKETNKKIHERYIQAQKDKKKPIRISGPSKGRNKPD